MTINLHQVNVETSCHDIGTSCNRKEEGQVILKAARGGGISGMQSGITALSTQV